MPAVRALVDAGHEVIALARTPAKAELLTRMGAQAHAARLFEVDSLEAMYAGCDAVVNLATHVPIGHAGAWPGAWRVHDRLRTEGVFNVVTAARRAGVRRVIQESVSFLYADRGDEWIDEQQPVEITSATEPAAVGEAHVHDYSCGSRVGVVLRFGAIVGDDALTRLQLKAAAHGRPVGYGSPDAWNHLVHTDDLGSAVVAALHAPTGIYNVGATPVRRRELVEGYATSAGVRTAGFAGPLLRRMAGHRIEPLTRSLRVSSEHFSAQTGWAPRRDHFSADWFDASRTPERSRRP